MRRINLANILIIFTFCFQAFGYLSLTEKGKNSLLWTDSSDQLHYQSCGATALPVERLEKTLLSELLAQCRQASPGEFVMPIEKFSASLLALSGVPSSPAGAHALSFEYIKYIEEKRKGVILDLNTEFILKLRDLQDNLLDPLGPDAHRNIAIVSDRPLLTTIYEAFHPAFYDQERFWLISELATSSTLDNRCPEGWQMASLDMILNSPSVAKIADWYLSESIGSHARLATWYRWKEPFPEQTQAFQIKEESLVVEVNRLSDAAAKFPASGSRVEALRTLPGINSLFFIDRADGTRYRSLCTHTYSPLTLLPPNDEKGLSVNEFAFRWKMTWEGLIRRLAPFPDLQNQLARHLYWKTPFTEDEIHSLGPSINERLGFPIISVADANQFVRLQSESSLTSVREDQLHDAIMAKLDAEIEALNNNSPYHEIRNFQTSVDYLCKRKQEVRAEAERIRDLLNANPLTPHDFVW